MSTERTRIRVLIPYFGAWPDYFQSLFLPSCARLAQVEFLLFTDCSIPRDAPKNVQFVPFTLADVNALATARIGKRVALRRAYKLCDLKAFYGHVFARYLDGYDYWGFGDIDLVFGELEAFVREPLARRCDIISLRKHWLSGSFCLMRNRPGINELWRKSSSWESVLETDDCLCFDECGGLFPELLAGQSILQLAGRCHSMTHVVRELERAGDLSVSFADHARESIRGDDFVDWDDGKVRGANGEEFAYYHTVCEKGLLAFTYPKWSTLPKHFRVTTSGFYTDDELAARWRIEPVRRARSAADKIFKQLPRRARASVERELAGRLDVGNLSYWTELGRVVVKKLLGGLTS